MKAKKKTRGRPPKALAERQSERLMVYLTPAERKQLEAEAREAGGLPLAVYLMSFWRKAKRKAKGG